MTEKKPNIKLLLGLIIGMLLVLGGFIASQEYTLNTGQDIYLKTVPVDPRDILRGDYVILRYEFEEDKILEEYITNNNVQTGEELYLSFSLDSEKEGTLSDVSESMPEGGVFLKVKKEESSWQRLRIDTGIDKYFVPEGTGGKIERVFSGILVHTKFDTKGGANIINLYYEGKKIDPKTFNP